MNKRPILKCTLAVACVATLLTATSVIPTERWTNLGKQAAWLSLGLDRPEQSVALLETWMQAPTEPPEEPTLTIPTVGQAQVRPATTVAVPLEKAEIPDGGGAVLTQQLSVGSSFVQGVAIKNNSKAAVDIAAALAHRPVWTADPNETAPQVLITHTHTTECYLEKDNGVYAPDDNSRTDDPAKNMVAVGEAVAAQLRMAGIGVVHDTAVHDQPYTGAYGHSKAAIQAFLKQYPTIRVVLDIHRDAIYPDDNSRIKPTVVIDGKKAAQVMIIVGMMNTKNVPNAYVQDNLALGARLQQRLHTDHPGLMRPLNLANARYNQQLNAGSVLLEMGSDVNTLDEALYAAELVGQGLVQVLRDCEGDE